MIGISIRFALAVGLHLRNENPSVAPARKELLIQTWWALQSVECLLSAITGRPCVISNDVCTVPLPQSFLDDRMQSSAPGDFSHSTRSSFSTTSTIEGSQANVSSPLSYLRSRIRIGLIAQETLSRLYSPRTATKSWDSIQKIIISLSKGLEDWAFSTAPKSIPSLTYESIHDQDFNPVSRSIQREQLLLAMSYQSLKLQITRPCLCRVESRIKEQNSASAEFNTRTAATCIQAAEDMTKLLPDDPAAEYIYEQGPWWCIVHYIMQAIAVFLLKITYPGSNANPNKRTDILQCIKKLLKWLKCLVPENAVAARAVHVVFDILTHAPEQLQAEFSDILSNEFDVLLGNLGNHIYRDFYDWNSDIQSRRSSTLDTDLSMLSHVQNFDSFGGQGAGSMYNASIPGLPPSEVASLGLVSSAAASTDASSPDSVYQWWLGDVGFQFLPSYNNPFQTTFDQPNPLSANMDT